MSETTFTVIDHDRKNRKEFDNRADAEDAADTAREFGSDDVEIVVNDGAETDGGNAAEVLAEETGKPQDEFEPDADVPAPDDLESVPGVAGGMAIDSDPLDVLPGWMTTQVSYNDRGDSSTTVNKRGCQVIAEYLGLDMVDRNVVKRAHETDFEFATYEITMKKPDGRTFTGTGTARADESDQGDGAGWKLDMMAETRAYKRAVKSATGGGIEAFAKEQDR
jgi:hypothetical protein